MSEDVMRDLVGDLREWAGDLDPVVRPFSYWLLVDSADEIDRLRAEKKSLCLQAAGLLEDVKRLRARITELERELNPDPEAHLMGWEGDDE